MHLEDPEKKKKRTVVCLEELTLQREGENIWQQQDYQVDSTNHCKRREECGGFQKMVCTNIVLVHVSDLDSTDYRGFSFHDILFYTEGRTKCVGCP